MPSKFKRKPGRSEWVDWEKFPQHLPVANFKGCSYKLEVCKPGTSCLMPSFDKKTGKYLGNKPKDVEKAIYIIRGCKSRLPPGTQRDCIFLAREMAESVLAHKCNVSKPHRPCKRAKPYVKPEKR